MAKVVNFEMHLSSMEIHISSGPADLGKHAGQKAAGLISAAIAAKGRATIILATGTSQFETLKYLVNEGRVDWAKVTMFHLDEYIGLPVTHPASFRKYLNERFISKAAPGSYHLIDGEADPAEECRRLGHLVEKEPVDVALVGIGENGHLAFNDPPADFDTDSPYIVVTLDEACRKQQLGEGWFTSMAEVPSRAISMSIRQIMKSQHIVCSVPDARKAVAVRNTLQEEVHPRFPATILREHPRCHLFLDTASAALVDKKMQMQ